MPVRSGGGSASSSTKTSLLSRIKAPFGPKARHIADNYIQPDDPHRQYGPGDVITGSVVLKVVKPFSVTHIVVCLHGYAQVYKTPNNPGEGYRLYNANLAAGRTKKSGGYYGNGFVSLFEDEVVLCGAGRLGEGTYQFNFELVFPKESMPSSIEFERGTVSYMITATMTRPTTISPTTTWDRKVNFLEDIDVAHLAVPKPRIISLEPIPRRTRTKRAKRSGKETAEDGQTPESAAGNNSLAEVNESQVDGEPPQSPVLSDVSFDSIMSSGGTGSAVDSAAQSAKTGDSKSSNRAHGHSTYASRRPITAAVEISKAGFLRGDTIPIKIAVSHTKQIKSLHGVIVTLYRHARVDMNPALPLVKGGDDDVYPRSRTGLGGLSLSSAGSTHLYRKDLSQSFASMIINPDTLTADIKASLRVPEEAFPSIASVPGAMISFKYYVEVVLDLQGKLAGLDRFLPNSGVSAVSSSNAATAVDATGTIFAAWGGHFINTEEIRRDKSVVSCVFEVAIGTRDSERKSAWKQWPLTPFYDVNDLANPAQGASHMDVETRYFSATDNRENNYSDGIYTANLPGDPLTQYSQPNGVGNDTLSPVTQFPPPDFAEEERLPEKERLRRAEARLLPSAPPLADLGSEPFVTAGAYAPTAPLLPDHRHPTVAAPSVPLGNDLNFGQPSVPRALFFSADEVNVESSAPAYHHHVPPLPSSAPTDDKQELQRTCLENERSAPEAISDGDEAVPEASARMLDLTPTAPVLTEEDQFGFNFHGPEISHQSLPRYER